MKTALVLSGGGAKGAFQAGAIAALAERGFEYQNVAGVSVGALNGVMVASGNINRMTEIWKTIGQNDIYTKHSIPQIALQYIAYKIGFASAPKSIYSNEPLFELLEREFENIKLQMPLTIGRVELESGNYVNEIDPENPAFARQVLASTAIPIIWEPVHVGNKLFVDGGVRNTTPLKDVIKTNPDRIIAITNGPMNIFEQQDIRDIVDIAERTLDIMLNEIFREDIERCKQINDLVRQAEEQGVQLFSESGRLLKNFELTIISPPESLGSPLDFDRSRLDVLLQMGREAAKEAVV